MRAHVRQDLIGLDCLDSGFVSSCDPPPAGLPADPSTGAARLRRESRCRPGHAQRQGPPRWCAPGSRKAIAQRTAISCDRDRPGEDPVCQWPPFPRGCGTTMSSTPSSRRRTTPCFVCIESDGIVGNFNARQQTSHARTLRNRRESQRFSAGYVGPNCVWRAREAESIGKRSGIDRERRLQ